MTSSVREETLTLRSADGLQLFARRWFDPEPAARWNLVVAHGLGEHSGRYSGFATWFAARGAQVHALDFRGHGRSPGRRGDAPSIEALLGDLLACLDAAATSRLPIVLVGHSWGGLLAIALLERHPVSAIHLAVISAPALQLQAHVGTIKRSLARVLVVVAPGLTMSNEVDPAILSHDPAVVNAYSSDPLVHNRISARLYGQTFAQAQELISKAGEIKLPYLLLHGGDDQLIDPAGSRSFFAASRAPDRALKVYPGLFHEVFNEVAREQVYSDVLSWLEARQAKLPSAAG